MDDELISPDQFIVSRGGGNRRRDPFAKQLVVTTLPSNHVDGDIIVAKIVSSEFGNRLIVWDGEDASYFFGITMEESMRGMSETMGRPFSRIFWHVEEMRSFSGPDFRLWLEADFCNGRGI